MSKWYTNRQRNRTLSIWLEHIRAHSQHSVSNVPMWHSHGGHTKHTARVWVFTRRKIICLHQFRRQIENMGYGDEWIATGVCGQSTFDGAVHMFHLVERWQCRHFAQGTLPFELPIEYNWETTKRKTSSIVVVSQQASPKKQQGQQQQITPYIALGTKSGGISLYSYATGDVSSHAFLCRCVRWLRC